MNNVKQHLFVVPNNYFKQGFIEYKKNNIFNINGMFMYDYTSNIDLALNLIKTCIFIKYKDKYAVKRINNTKYLCNTRFVTKKDKHIDTISNSINNHAQELLPTNNKTIIDTYGYIYNLLRYKNIVYFVSSIEIKRKLKLDFEYYVYNDLIESYFKFDQLSREIINYLYLQKNKGSEENDNI